MLKNAHNTWENGGGVGKGADFFGTSNLTNTNSNLWNRLGTCRIDIRTNFDENWYKRKFKSGMLNKMIMAVKTDAMSHFDKGAKAHVKDADHKYTADEMLPSDQKKLDSIRWKMTNKVVTDYIRLLLGWTREKKLYKEGAKDGAQYRPATPIEEM